GSSASKISGPLMKDSRLRKISFTGSTPVGRRLLADASENVLRTSMELGGNAPFIVFDDADIDAAVEGAMAAKLRNMGEACTAANRILVHEDVAEEFNTKFAEAMRARKVGRGTEADVNVGPIIDENAREDVHGLVTEAVEAGAEVVTGGKKVDGDGYFYEPTILSAWKIPLSWPKRSLVQWHRLCSSKTKTTLFGWRTLPNTAWPPTCTPPTTTVHCVLPTRSNSV